MVPWIILVLVTLFIAGRLTQHFLATPKAIKSKYDVHSVRKMEIEIYGFAKSFCKDESCRECYPPKAIGAVWNCPVCGRRASYDVALGSVTLHKECLAHQKPQSPQGPAAVSRNYSACIGCGGRTKHRTGYCMDCFRSLGSAERNRALEGRYSPPTMLDYKATVEDEIDRRMQEANRRNGNCNVCGHAGFGYLRNGTCNMCFANRQYGGQIEPNKAVYPQSQPGPTPDDEYVSMITTALKTGAITSSEARKHFELAYEKMAVVTPPAYEIYTAESAKPVSVVKVERQVPRWYNLGNYMVQIPDGVPDDPDVTWESVPGRDVINVLWTWDDEVSGQKCGFRSTWSELTTVWQPPMDPVPRTRGGRGFDNLLPHEEII